MFLSLERLSPLASHIICVLLGIALSYFGIAESSENQRFLPDKIFFALPNTFSKNTNNLVPGHRVHFIKEENGTTCFLHNSKAIIEQKEPFLVVSIPNKDHHVLELVQNKKNKGKIRLIRDQDSSLPLTKCSNREILYGS